MSKRWFERIGAFAVVCLSVVVVGSSAAHAASPGRKPDRFGLAQAAKKVVTGLRHPLRKASRLRGASSPIRPVSWLGQEGVGGNGTPCPECPSGPLGRARCWLTHRCGGLGLRSSLSGHAMRVRYHQQSRLLQQQLAAKLAYFTPSGCCGAGCPPFGGYHVVYAVRPDYFDPRDGQIVAAPGIGVPMAVPLAPNVHYSYNYSHGVPSSRITPISDVIPPRRVE
ncbi:MAG TPA: hypothetical protein EYP14_11520 [Planctomycetaceae bacterium]|nr:hypothetical protein [Planctomycetaceae bacterium]